MYYVARRWFGFNREWAVPLASGISICGVAAGGGHRAAPSAPARSFPCSCPSLVVIFAVVEVLILPFLAQAFLSHEPLVAAAWMGLAVKTDGGAVAAGGITEALLLAKNSAEGVNYQAGWILGTTAAIKIFIDVFIGVWSFILAFIWTRYINVVPGEEARAVEIWQRFPKFILGFALTFGVTLALVLTLPKADAAQLTATVTSANAFRVIFFILTFFSIGVMSNFNRLWQAGIGRLAAGLCRQPVRLRHLGRPRHFLDLLRRHQAAAGRLRSTPVNAPNPKPDLKTELGNAAYEPLLPIEKKLIGWSLGIGVTLLIGLWIVSKLFPVG